VSLDLIQRLTKTTTTNSNFKMAATQEDKDKLEGIVNSASKIVCCQLPSLDGIYQKRTKKRVKGIAEDSSHPSYHIFDLLPPGRRYRTIKTRTNRFQKSFFPSTIIILNNCTDILLNHAFYYLRSMICLLDLYF